MVRATVLVGDEPFAEPEDADFELADSDDAIVAIGQFAAGPDHDLTHYLSPVTAGSLGARTTWRYRTNSVRRPGSSHRRPPRSRSRSPDRPRTAGIHPRLLPPSQHRP